MAAVQVTRRMLQVLDVLDRAFGVVTPTTEAHDAIQDEFKQAYEMVLETFGQMGVETVPTVGTEFDYELHQAVMQKPSEDYEEGIVCEELQKGYKIGDTLVRAAMVSVAA
jgi:molecular chaperone GrpE